MKNKETKQYLESGSPELQNAEEQERQGHRNLDVLIEAGQARRVKTPDGKVRIVSTKTGEILLYEDRRAVHQIESRVEKEGGKLSRIAENKSSKRNSMPTDMLDEDVRHLLHAIDRDNKKKD